MKDYGWYAHKLIDKNGKLNSGHYVVRMFKPPVITLNEQNIAAVEKIKEYFEFEVYENFKYKEQIKKPKIPSE